MNPVDDRPYQDRTISAVHAYRMNGGKRCLVVAPTSSGKTHIAARCVGEGRLLWLAHRRELVDQAARKLEELFGTGNVNRVMPDVPRGKRFPGARIQVGTIQTHIERDTLANVEMLVVDEAHRYLAKEYRHVVARYPQAFQLGITATPERHDGTPLGDMFDQLIVAAQHSELIAGGWIMKLRVVQPQIDLKGDMAADALSAYCQHSNGDRAFVFNADVDMAECFAKLFRRAGIRAGCIEGNTPHAYRRDAIGSFSTLDESMIGTRVLTSVYTLQEGIDVPIASVAILARRFQFSGALLQSVGRIGRPAEGKVHATVIDLTGATIRHGSPNADRDYSLEGRAIVPRTKGVEREPAERGFHVIRPTDLVVAERGSEPAGWEPKPVVTKYIPTAEEVETIIGRVLGRSGSTVARTIRKVVQGMAS